MKGNPKETQMSASSGDRPQKGSIRKHVKDEERRENKMARNGNGREGETGKAHMGIPENTHTH